MFSRSAPYYDLMYGFKDYVAASRQISQVLAEHHPTAESLLDVGCGTARHLVELSRLYSVEGLDVNETLLESARVRCPGTVFHLADMATFSIPRNFDVITCLFSSIAYLKDLKRMHEAVATMYRHLRPGGVVLVEPWFTPDDYWTDTITTNSAESDEAHIAWMYTSTTRGRTAVLDINYLVGKGTEIEHFTECHELGLFTDWEYRGALEEHGMEVTHYPEEPFGRGLYVGIDR